MGKINKEIQDRILTKYKEVADDFKIDHRILIRDFYRHYHVLELIKKYKPHNDNKVLDVSAGFAIPSRILQEDGYNVTATDSISIAGSLTFEITQKIFTMTNIENLEIDSLPFDECTFDIIFWLATIEHIHNSPKRILNWIYKILKKDGIVIIDTPNILELRRRIMLLFGKSFMPPIQFVYNSDYHSGHHREYTKSDLEYVMLQSGFEIKYSKIIDTISQISIDNRNSLDRRESTQSELEQMTKFKVGSSIFNFYDWVKLPYSILVRIFPSFRDTIFIVGVKH